MRKHCPIIGLAICALVLVLLPLNLVQAQNNLVYNVQVRSDGSALWTISQLPGVNGSVESFDYFQQQIFSLNDSVVVAAQRDLSIDEETIQISTTINEGAESTEYSFVWRNFSVVNDGQLSFGDVFKTEDFFGRLFGDGALQLTYPSNYNVETVKPQPYERFDSDNTMLWLRTQDLTDGPVSVVLVSRSQNPSATADWQIYGLIVGVVSIGVVISVLGFYSFKRRHGTDKIPPAETQVSLLDTEEDKVLKVLKLAGGAMRQSEIVEQCRFSKAKTSQLLTALEKSGCITRYKKGRDKIVTLKRTGKGE